MGLGAQTQRRLAPGNHLCGIGPFPEHLGQGPMRDVEPIIIASASRAQTRPSEIASQGQAGQWQP